MTTFNAIHKPFQAVIAKNGSVTVKKATKGHIQGCVYFSSKTKAFKVATLLLGQGLITAKRKGFMVTPKDYLEVTNGYYLGCVLVSKKGEEVSEDELHRSELIHGACYARS